VRPALRQGPGTGVEGPIDLPADEDEPDDQSAKQQQLGRQVEDDDIADRADDCRSRADPDQEGFRR
jgi:hypothetical protein